MTKATGVKAIYALATDAMHDKEDRGTDILKFTNVLSQNMQKAPDTHRAETDRRDLLLSLLREVMDDQTQGSSKKEGEQLSRQRRRQPQEQGSPTVAHWRMLTL